MPFDLETLLLGIHPINKYILPVYKVIHHGIVHNNNNNNNKEWEKPESPLIVD